MDIWQYAAQKNERYFMKPSANELHKEMKKYSKQHYKSAVANCSDRPYWMWDTVIDCRSCDVCKELHRKVFMWDDPIWKEHLPPIHKTCRCGFRALDADYLQEKNLKLSKGSDFSHLFSKTKRAQKEKVIEPARSLT